LRLRACAEDFGDDRPPSNSAKSRRSNSARILVPAKTTIANWLAMMNQPFSCSEQRADSDAPSLEVAHAHAHAFAARTRSRSRSRSRTTKTWGITGSELNRLSAAVRFMKLDSVFNCSHLEADHSITNLFSFAVIQRDYIRGPKRSSRSHRLHWHNRNRSAVESF